VWAEEGVLPQNPSPGPSPKRGGRFFFAADGMVHGVRLEAGQARWYRNRYVKIRQEPGIRGGASSNTHVFAYAGHILSFVEVGAAASGARGVARKLGGGLIRVAAGR